MKEKIQEVQEVSNFKRYLEIAIGIVVILAIIFSGIFFFNEEEVVERIPTCGDSSFYDTCSLTKPYYCLNGSLFEKASICGCAEGFVKLGDSCTSLYNKEGKFIVLDYVLRGEKGSIDFVVYPAVNDYLENISRSILYKGEEKPFRGDFKLLDLNEELQRVFLLPLVIKIQNLTQDKDDQARIAISLVQNIPFGFSDEVLVLRGQEVEYSRYPYEVLYDYAGVCGEKAELLAFLLRELNYGVVFFYHSLENHESLGVKCPVEFSVENTGYCFIETTGPSVITDNKMEYLGGIKLYSKPEVILISDGLMFGENNFYEVQDAEELQEIYFELEDDGKINVLKSSRLTDLQEKYGLRGDYNL